MKATRYFLTSGVLALVVLATSPAAAKADSLFGIGIVVGGGHGRYDARDAYHHGFERGRADGAEHGYKDGRKCRDFNFWHHSEYRDGDRGYRRWMGPRWDYVAGYRRGYESGYRRAYASARPGWHDRNARYWRDDRYRDGDRYRGDRRYGYDEDRYRYEDRRR